jgi:hypothetical protein
MTHFRNIDSPAPQKLRIKWKMLTIEREAAHRIGFMSRKAKAFMGAEPPFDASLEYESDVDGLVNCHPSWVCGDKDLTDLGLEVRKQLQANPALIYE